MTSKAKKAARALFLCLFVATFAKAPVFAFDRKASSAIRHYIMGVLCEDLGDIDEAIREYKGALRDDRQATVIHLNLASAYIKQNNIPAAVEESKSAAKLDPDSVEPHAILALLYTSQNKIDLATGEYELALKNAAKLQPKNIEVYKSLGFIYLQQKKYKDAEKAFRLLAELAPEDAQPHFYLGSIYNELKKNDLAEGELREALRLKPDYHEALNFLGYLYVEGGKNLAQAEEMITRALESEPNNGAYRDSLGWLYFKQDKLTQALKELEAASSLIDDPVIFDHLGEAYFKAGDLQKARGCWEQSLKLDPGQEKVEEKLEKLTSHK